jgi:hypothetical protein
MVLWKRYLLEACTWEPDKALSNCAELIDEFYEAFPRKPGAAGVKPKGLKKEE